MEASKKNQRGSRGGGRAGNRGRARGRGRGRGLAGTLDFARSKDAVVDVSLAAAGLLRSMTSKAGGRKLRALDKKNKARLTDDKRAQLQELRNRKEVGQFLMPDAPPSKKRRNVSPVRVPCPLIPGTPPTPPKRIPQPWELKKSALAASGPASGSRVEVLEEDAASPPPPKDNQLVFTPSPEVTALDESIELDENLMVNPSSIKLLGLVLAESPSLHNFSPEPSTSSTRPDPEILTENLEEEIVLWEGYVTQNPGSDVEDEDCLDDLHPRRRHAGEFALEDLPIELVETLGSIDRHDDCVLRELSQEDMLTFDWSHDPQVFTGVREKFTGPAGPTFPIEGMSPFQIFTKIWDEDIINLIVNETNKYAASFLSSPLPPSSRFRRWTPITPQELWTFFGIVMLQSIVPIPVEKEYWTPSLPYLKMHFNNIMHYSRFTLIKRCLHFVDNNLCAKSIPTKLMKIQPIIDHLNNKFSSLYLPGQEIAIDESLMLWKGRLSFSQVIATKAAQVGIKSYELCESKTGYLWQMTIYTGKNEQHNFEADENGAESESATSKTVLKLLRPLLNRGHTLVMDNFYNSPLLARTLKAQKTDVMGTLRLHREFVPDSLRLKNKTNMRPGEVVFSQTRDMTITVWRDVNHVVSLISTYHKVEVGGKEKYGYYRYKPKVVLDYNLTMGGVDKKDQLLQAFPIERIRNLTWYKKLFRRLFNVSIHNAFVMFAAGKGNLAQRQFRVMLADEIIKSFRPPAIQRPTERAHHFPGKNDKKRARCKWCAMQKKDVSTVYKCIACNVNLCIVGCFKDYHVSLGLA